MGYGAILGQTAPTPSAQDVTVQSSTAQGFGLTDNATLDQVLQILKSSIIFKTNETPVPLSAVVPGSIIQLNENGIPTDFIVGGHNYESSENGSGRTIIMRANPYQSTVWRSPNSNVYANSNVDTFLNSEYKSLLDSDVQAAIGSTSFPYTPGGGNKTVAYLSRPIFLLSMTEFTGGSAYDYNIEGTVLSPIAQSIKPNISDKAWTRSPDISLSSGNSGIAICATSSGMSGQYTSNSFPIYPAFTLPDTFSANTITTVEIVNVKGEELQPYPFTRIATGSYVGTGTYGQDNPNSLTFDFSPIFVAIMFSSFNANGAISVIFGGYTSGQTPIMYPDSLTTTPKSGVGFSNGGNSSGTRYGYKSSDGKTIYWYSSTGGTDNGPIYQFNSTSYTYYYIAIG